MENDTFFNVNSLQDRPATRANRVKRAEKGIRAQWDHRDRTDRMDASVSPDRMDANHVRAIRDRLDLMGRMWLGAGGNQVNYTKHNYIHTVYINGQHGNMD